MIRQLWHRLLWILLTSEEGLSEVVLGGVSIAEGLWLLTRSSLVARDLDFASLLTLEDGFGWGFILTGAMKVGAVLVNRYALRRFSTFIGMLIWTGFTVVAYLLANSAPGIPVFAAVAVGNAWASIMLAVHRQHLEE